MRISIDTGGTFTDVVLEDDNGLLSVQKAPTTPHDPVLGIIEGIARAATSVGLETAELLARTTTLVHGTTRATNAILTHTTARTAFLTTHGHPDILLFRTGGREEPFNHSREFPAPYVPRALTFEVEERIDFRGDVVRELDEASVVRIAARLRRARGRGGRRLPAVVDRQSRARAAGRRAAARARSGPRDHALARAEPGHPRVPPRVGCVHRRVAQAADDGLPHDARRAARRRPASAAGCSSPASAAGCSNRTRSPRRRFTRSTLAPRWPRSLRAATRRTTATRRW